MCGILHCALARHYIKKETVIYIPINKGDMGGQCRPVPLLMQRTRGAVHQSVNSLPQAGLRHTPLYGISHLNTPPSLPCSSLGPSPSAPVFCLLCPRPLVCSFPCFDHVSLLWPEQRAVITLCPMSSSSPPPFHHIIAQCTLNAPGICGIVYVSGF